MQGMSTERRSRRGRGSSNRSAYSSRHGRETKSNKKDDSFSFRSSRKRDSRFAAEPLFKKSSYRSSYTLPSDQLREEDAAIRSYKTGEKPICPKCGLPIADMGSALVNKEDGQPMHFDCALALLSEREQIAENERLTYIGQGRFGILEFVNIHDLRHFTIKKIIEWEDKDSRPEWRSELAGLYSQVR